jgi:hypothetical protein
VEPVAGIPHGGFYEGGRVQEATASRLVPTHPSQCQAGGWAGGKANPIRVDGGLVPVTNCQRRVVVAKHVYGNLFAYLRSLPFTLVMQLLRYLGIAP